MNEKTLAEEIADVLGVSLNGRAKVASGDGHVLLTLTSEDFQHHFKDVLQHTSIIISQAFPIRLTDIYLLIRDEGGICQQQICLQHTS